MLQYDAIHENSTLYIKRTLLIPISKPKQQLSQNKNQFFIKNPYIKYLNRDQKLTIIALSNKVNNNIS